MAKNTLTQHRDLYFLSDIVPSSMPSINYLIAIACSRNYIYLLSKRFYQKQVLTRLQGQIVTSHRGKVGSRSLCRTLSMVLHVLLVLLAYSESCLPTLSNLLKSSQSDILYSTLFTRQLVYDQS